MKRGYLGKTGIEVTELCFGALPLGPLQSRMPEEQAVKLILAALNSGINFIDTAELYQTQIAIGKALQQFKGDNVVIATKSTASTYEDMEKSVLKAIAELGRDYIDIFLIHAAKVTPQVFADRSGALKCLLDYKAKGIIRAIGISTHAVSVVEKAAEVEEIDVIFPIINRLGIGIIGGTKEDMLHAIEKAEKAGKGLFAMKALAGGHLINDLKDSFNFVRNIPGIVSVAVGMVSMQELEIDLKLFNNENIPENLASGLKSTKTLLVSRFCLGCGTCAEACPNNALSIIDGKAVVNKTLCLLCGYCNPVCPEFAIRLI